METNYTLKNLIRGGTLLLFFLAFMLTGPQSAEAQAPMAIVDLEVVIDGPPGSQLVVYKSPVDYQIFTGPVTATISVSTGQVINIGVLTTTCIEFVEWEDISSGVPTPLAAPPAGITLGDIFFTYTMPATTGATLKAVYQNVDYLLTATVNPLHGTVEITQPAVGTTTATVACTEVFEVVATATPGFTFDRFVVTGGAIAGTYDADDPEVGKNDIYSYTLTLEMPDDDVEVTAHFVERLLTTEVSGVGGGTVSTTIGSLPEVADVTDEPVTAGESVTVVATPDTGWEFVEWTGTFTGTSTTLSFNMPDNNATVTANFKERHLVTVEADLPAVEVFVFASGTVTGTFIEGTILNIGSVGTVSPGFAFTGWTADPDAGSFGDASLLNTTYTMPDQAVDLTANFVGAVTLTIAQDGDGTGTVLPFEGTNSNDYFSGQEVVFTATAAAGSTFDDWDDDGFTAYADGGQDTKVGTATATMGPTAATITATFVNYSYAVDEQGDGSGDTVVTPEAGSFDAQNVTAGAEVGLSFTAGAGQTLVSYQVEDDSGDIIAVTAVGGKTATDTFTMPASNVTITATYEEYVVAGLINPAEAADYTGPVGGITQGETVTVTFNYREIFGPNSNEAAYKFNNWTSAEVGFADANSPETSFAMIGGNVTVTANFDRLNELVLVQPATGGSIGLVTDTYFYDEGESFVLVITADEDYTFTGFAGNMEDPGGAIVSFDTSDLTFAGGVATLTWHSDIGGVVTITANFEQYTYVSEIRAGDELKGEVTPETPTPLRAGEVATVTATGLNGHTFTGWDVSPATLTLNTSGVNTAVGTATFTMPAGNVTVTAQFEEYKVNTTVFENTGGSIDPETQRVPAGKVWTVTATADTGWTFEKFEFDGDPIDPTTVDWNVSGEFTETGVVTFTMPASNVTVRAFFKQYFLTVGLDPDNGNEVEVDGDTYVAPIPVTLGTTVELNAIPELDEYLFGHWSGDGFAVNVTTNPYTYTMPAGAATGAHVTATFNKLYDLDIVVVGDGDANVIPAGNKFIEGDNLVIRADADDKWTFANFDASDPAIDVAVGGGAEWDAADGGVATLTFTMPDSPLTVTVTFVQHNLALVRDDLDGLDDYLPTHEGPITSGTEVVVQAIANENWVFDAFLIEGSPIDFVEDGKFESVGTATFTMPAGNVTLTAQFIKYNKLVLVVVDDEGGQFIGDYTDVHYFPPSTTEVPIEVVADANYQLVGITADDGTLAGGDPLPAAGGVYTVTFDHALSAGGVVTVTAQFAQDIELTTVVDPEGAGTIDIELIAPIAPLGGTITEPAGSHIKLTATPAGVDEWIFVEWVFEPALAPVAILAGSLTDNEIEIVVPSVPTTVTARFRPFYDIKVEGAGKICLSQNSISDLKTYSFFTDLTSPDFASFIWEAGPEANVESISGMTTATATIQWKIGTQNVYGSDDGEDGTFVRVRAYNAAGDQVARSDYFPVSLFIDIDGLTVSEPAPFCPVTGSTTVDVSIVPIGAQNGVRTTGSSDWSKVGGPGELTIVETTPDVFGESYTISNAPAPGIYTYTYTAFNGSCSESTTVVFEVFDLVDGVEIVEFPSAPICFDDTAFFAATVSVTNTGVSVPTFDYAWTVDGAPFGINSSSFTFNPAVVAPAGIDTPTMYEVMVTVTQNDGCVAVVTDVFDIEVLPTPEFTPVIPAVATNHYCYDSFIEVTLADQANLYYSATATTTFTYVLVGQDFAETTITTNTYNIDDITIEFGPLTPGSYTLTVTVNNHYCETTADPVNFHVYEQIESVVITEVVDAICWDKDFVFTATPTFSTFGIEAEEEPTYSWYVDGSQELTGVGESEFPFDATVYAAGITETTTYNVTVVALDFCGITTVTYSQSIAVNPQPVIYFTFGGVAIEEGGVVSTCFNSTDVFAIEEAYGSYPFYIEADVTNGVGLVTKTIESGDTFSIEDLLGVGFEPGKYDVTINKIVDDNGCEVANPHLYYNFELNIHPEPVLIFAFNGEEITEGKDLGTVCWDEAADLDFTILYTVGEFPFTFEAKILNEDGDATVTTTVIEDSGWTLHLTDFLAAIDLLPGTHTVTIESITDLYGCESESTASYTFTIDIQATPFATITGVPVEVCVDDNVTLSLVFDQFNTTQIGNYTVTWTVSAFGEEKVLVRSNTLDVTFNSYELFENGVNYHQIDVEAVIVNAACEYETEGIDFNVKGKPYITKNAIQDPAENVFCSTIPAGIKIFGEDDVDWIELEQYPDCDPIYLWRRSVLQADDSWGPWVSTGDASEFNRDYTLPGITQTTRYKRLVKLTNCGDCGDEIYNWNVEIASGNNAGKYHASNIVTMYVLDADHFEAEITSHSGSDNYFAFPGVTEVSLEANAIPQFAAGLWTWDPVAGLTITPTTSSNATAIATLPGAYNIKWSIFPDPDDDDNSVNMGSCFSDKGDDDDITIIFEELLVDELDQIAPVCEDTGLIDLVLPEITIYPEDGDYTAVFTGTGVDSDDNTFDTSVGAGTYVITLTVTSSQTDEEIIRTTDIVVNERPTLDITWPAATEFCYDGEFDITIAGNDGVTPWTVVYEVNGEESTLVVEVSETITLDMAEFAAGEYTFEIVSVDDGNNCVAVEEYEFEFTVLPEPAIAVTIPDNDGFCYDEDVVITLEGTVGTGPWTVVYDINETVFTALVTEADGYTITLSGYDAGEYVFSIVSITDDNTCETDSDFEFEFEIFVEPTVSFEFYGDEIDDAYTYCYNETVTASIVLETGEYPFTVEYQIGEDGTPVEVTLEDAEDTEIVFSGIDGAGEYVIIINEIIDGNDCVVADAFSFSIVVNPEPAVLFAVNGDVVFGEETLDEFCFDTEITVTLDQIVTGAGPLQSLAWTVHVDGELDEDLSGEETGVDVGTELFETGTLAAATYVVQLTELIDANGCEPASLADYTFTLVVNPEPAVLFAVNEEVVFGGALLDDYCYNTPITVTLSEIVTGDGPLQSLEWTVHFNGVLNEDLSGELVDVAEGQGLFGSEELAAGTYVVQLTELIDANECAPESLEDYNFTLVINPKPVVLITPLADEYCYNEQFDFAITAFEGTGTIVLEYLITHEVHGVVTTYDGVLSGEVGEEFNVEAFAAGADNAGDWTFEVTALYDDKCVADDVDTYEFSITILPQPFVTNNFIDTPKVAGEYTYVFCNAVPSGEVNIFGIDEPIVIHGGDTDDLTIQYRWFWREVTASGWSVWTQVPGITTEGSYQVPGFNETRQYRRDARAIYADPCGEGANNTSPWVPSNIVTMYVVDNVVAGIAPVNTESCIDGSIELNGLGLSVVPEYGDDGAATGEYIAYNTGVWTLVDDDLVFDATAANIEITSDVAGVYEMIWTITAEPFVYGCTAVSNATVDITFESFEFDADPADNFDLPEVVCNDSSHALTLPTVSVDPDAEVTITLVVNNGAGEVTYEGDDAYAYVFEPAVPGTYEFIFTASTDICGELTASAMVEVLALPEAPVTTPVVVCADGNDHGFEIAPAPADHVLVYWDVVEEEWSEVLPEFSAAGVHEITVKYVREEAPFCEGPEATAELVIQSLELDNVVANFGLDAMACADALDAVVLELPTPVVVPADVVVTETLTLGGVAYALDYAFDLTDAGTYEFVYTAVTSGGCEIEETATIVVSALPPAPVVADVLVYYDGTAKEFDVEEAPADHTLEWAATADGVFTDDDLPTYTDAGDYTIWVRFVADTAPFCAGPAEQANLTILPAIVVDGMYTTARSMYFTWDDGDVHSQFMVSLTEADKDAHEWTTVEENFKLFKNLEPGTEYTFSVKSTTEFAVLDEHPEFVATVTQTTLAKGDVNEDNVVNLLDIELIVAKITNNLDRVEIEYADELVDVDDDVFILDAADMNGDGVIDIFDIVQVVNVVFPPNFDKSNIDSSDADMFLGTDAIQLDSDGTLAAIQLELTGSMLEDVKLSMNIPGLLVEWKVEGDVLTAIVFSPNNQLIDAGQSAIINIENGSDLEWGKVYASNIAAERVNVNVHYDQPTSTFPDFAGQLALDVYPNPSGGQFTSHVDVPVNSNVTFRLYDMNGRQVAIQQLEAAAGGESVSWNLDLNPGFYVLRMVAIPEGRTELAVTREVRVIIN